MQYSVTSHKKDQGSGISRRKQFFQPKLSINKPGDKYEKEADQVADLVLRKNINSSIPFFSPSSGYVQRKCSECEEEDKEDIQRKESDGSKSAGDVDGYIESLPSGGSPLPKTDRDFFEPRFGYDFSGVQIHTDSKANQSATSINALAYTSGNHIVFNHDQYKPGTDDGRKLLAHELTHVVQQRHAGVRRMIQRQQFLAYASGFGNPFASVFEEARCGHQREIGGNPDCHWSPWNDDMSASASKSGGGTPVATLNALLSFIGTQSTGSITALGIIGHSNKSFFALGGQVLPYENNVLFNQPAANITAKSLADNVTRIEALKDRFAPGARIILFGCNAGASGELTSAFAKAFHVCAEGFRHPIQYHINVSTEGGRITRNSTVSGRGRIQSSETMERFESEGLMSGTMFKDSVWELKPDSGLFCYDGTPATVDSIFSLVTEARNNPDQQGYYSQQIMQAILHRFFNMRAYAGGGYPDLLVNSLSFREDITGMLILPREDGKVIKGDFEIGNDFIKSFDRKTMASMLGAIEKALDTISGWRQDPKSKRLRHIFFPG